MLFVVRHAHAGDRSGWHLDDRERPLSRRGEAQADAIADRLAPLAAGLLLSSPYLRCVQTLQPLAARLGHDVETDERLAEDTGFTGAIDLLHSAPDGSVLCSHGDVIPDTIGALQRRGCRIDGAPDWRKGSVWALHLEQGAIVSATSWPPPDA